MADRRRVGSLLDNTSEKVEKYMFVHCTYSTQWDPQQYVLLNQTKKDVRGKSKL